LPFLWRMLGLGAAMRFDRSILSTAMRYGTPLLVASVVTWLSVNSLRVVVDWFEGAAAVGLVSVGWSLGQRASSVAAMLVTAAAYPLAVKRAVTHSREAALMQLSQSGASLFGVVAPVTIGALIINRTAVDLLIGADFRSLTVVIFPIAMLSGAIRNLRLHYPDQTFLLCERTDVALFVCSMEAALTLPFCVVGLLAGGLVGACLGCLVAHAIAAIFTFGAYLSRQSRWRFRWRLFAGRRPGSDWRLKSLWEVSSTRPRSQSFIGETFAICWRSISPSQRAAPRVEQHQARRASKTPLTAK
jgi:O-antigen/teichoic acid export membrane protein